MDNLSDTAPQTALTEENDNVSMSDFQPIVNPALETQLSAPAPTMQAPASQPADALPPSSASEPKDYRRLWFLTYLSLGFNAFLILFGIFYFFLVRGETRKISGELDKLNIDQVTIPITIAQDLPVKMEFPYRDTIIVPVDTTIPVNLTVKVDQTIQVPIKQEIKVNSDVLVNVPVLGPQRVPFSTTIPIDMLIDVPINLEIPVNDNIPVKFDVTAPIDTLIKIDTTMPVNMNFPVTLPVDELGTGPLVDQVSNSLSRIFFFWR